MSGPDRGLWRVRGVLFRVGSSCRDRLVLPRSAAPPSVPGGVAMFLRGRFSASNGLLTSALRAPRTALFKAHFSALPLAHPKFINHEFIDEVGHRLIRDKKTTPPIITEFLDVYKTRMNASNFIHFLDRVGRRQLLKPYHIYIVACGLRFVDNGQSTLSLDQLDTIFKSLKYLSARVGGVRCLVEITAERLQQNTEPLSSQRVGHYLRCFSDMKSGHREVRQMAQVLEKKIQSALHGPLSDADFATGFQAMHLLSSRYGEVRSLLSTLNSALLSSPERATPFLSAQVPRVLTGFQRLSPETKEVRDLLSTVLSKIDRSSLTGFTSREVSGALCAVCEISSLQGTEERELLAVLGAMVTGAEGEALTAEQLATPLEKLRELQQRDGNDQSKELRDLLGALQKQ
jgi:hypothetical protein